MGGGLLDRALRVTRRLGNGFMARNSVAIPRGGVITLERLTWDSCCSSSNARTLEMTKYKYRNYEV